MCAACVAAGIARKYRPKASILGFHSLVGLMVCSFILGFYSLVGLMGCSFVTYMDQMWPT